MRQLALQLSAQPEASFVNFVPGRNAELLGVLRTLASGQGRERFVYLWGAPGSGRGHLLQAFVSAAAAAGKRASQLVAPVAASALAALEGDDVVGLEAVEHLDGEAQRALFGLYNRVREGGGALVASGESAPAGLALRSDLATRLAWGLVYEVHALSDEEKAQAMSARAAQFGFVLPLEAQTHILRHGKRDLPSLLALVDLIDRHSLAAQRAVTLPLVREVLRMAQADGRGAGV
jgi:DnaA-homolog protein